MTRKETIPEQFLRLIHRISNEGIDIADYRHGQQKGHCAWRYVDKTYEKYQALPQGADFSLDQKRDFVGIAARFYDDEPQLYVPSRLSLVLPAVILLGSFGWGAYQGGIAGIVCGIFLVSSFFLIVEKWAIAELV